MITERSLQEIIDDSVIDGTISDIMMTIEYLASKNIKLRNSEFEELRNKRGPLYSLILYEYRKQKIEKIKNAITTFHKEK